MFIFSGTEDGERYVLLVLAPLIVLIWPVVLSVISVTYVNLVEPTDSDLDFIAPEDDEEDSVDGGTHQEDVVMNSDVDLNADDVDSEDEEDEDATPHGATSGVDADVRACHVLSYVLLNSLCPIPFSPFIFRIFRETVTRRRFLRAASLPALIRGFGCRCRLIR